MNELHKHVAVRLDQVTNRLKALEKERTDLISEHTSLHELHQLYKNQLYDPIEEERRVTEGVLQAAATKEIIQAPKQTYNVTGISIYDEPFKLIFTTVPNPLSMLQIKKYLEDLLGKPIAYKNVDAQVRVQIRKGNIYRADRGAYSWNGEKQDAGTKALPD